MFIFFAVLIIATWRISDVFHEKSTLISPKLETLTNEEFIEICNNVHKGMNINTVDNEMLYGTRKISINREGISVRRYWIVSDADNSASPTGTLCDVAFDSSGSVFSSKLNRL